MSVDYPEPGVLHGSVVGSIATLAQGSPITRLLPAASTTAQSATGTLPMVSPGLEAQEQKQQVTLQPPEVLPSPQTRLFSHLPLHSQQQSRTPYNMVPVGGIHVVPAGLTYSTFVPIPAGPLQLTIPAVNVIHRTSGPQPMRSRRRKARRILPWPS